MEASPTTTCGGNSSVQVTLSSPQLLSFPSISTSFKENASRPGFINKAPHGTNQIASLQHHTLKHIKLTTPRSNDDINMKKLAGATKP
jgi:hypothetical protein